MSHTHLTSQCFCLGLAAQDTNMLSLRVSLICLLWFSSGSCFPKPEGHGYPYAAPWGSGGGSAPGSDFPSAQPVPIAPTGNWAPSSVGAHSVAVGLPPSYEPGWASGSSGSKPLSAPEVPSQGAGYVSPPGPASTGSLSKPQSSGTSGHSSVVSGGVASSPAYGSSPAYAAAGHMASPSNYAAPAAFNFNSGSSGATTNSVPASHYPADTSRHTGPATFYSAPEISSYGYDAAPETSSYGYYDAAPETSYGGGSDFDLAWAVQPVEASFSNPNDWMPDGVFPDFSVWGTGGNSQSQSKTKTIHTEEPSAVPSSTYLIQSGNGYIRARQFQSHTNYAPEDPETLVFVAEPRRVVTKTRPAAPPKGGKKI